MGVSLYVCACRVGVCGWMCVQEWEDGSVCVHVCMCVCNSIFSKSYLLASTLSGWYLNPRVLNDSTAPRVPETPGACLLLTPSEM